MFASINGSNLGLVMDLFMCGKTREPVKNYLLKSSSFSSKKEEESLRKTSALLMKWKDGFPNEFASNRQEVLTLWLKLMSSQFVRFYTRMHYLVFYGRQCLRIDFGYCQLILVVREFYSYSFENATCV